ncbi:hypothetical protein B4135_1488 [Caldibacillus debilis]|uniref:Uncharacterized protein n=1 Tax=Caldibacillus debilis TaxID=301148 RepID=A0A150MCA2_9BACI|nr:hypothetical protein B4135_1488 [Caldibacillus debilis]
MQKRTSIIIILPSVSRNEETGSFHPCGPGKRCGFFPCPVPIFFPGKKPEIKK